MIRLFCVVIISIGALLGADSTLIQPAGCDVTSIGQTGNKLPVLVKDAIKLVQKLPAAMVGDPGQLTAENVVVIGNMNKFFACWAKNAPEVSDPKWQEDHRNTVFFTDRKYGIVFLNGERDAVRLGAQNYSNLEMRQRNMHLPYQFAAYLSHELGHLHGDKGESGPLSIQVVVLQYFQKQGKLPPAIQEEINYTADLAERYRKAEFAGATLVAAKPE